VSVVKALIDFLWDLLFWIFREGTWSLLPHEKIVIGAAIDFLPAHDQALLRSQLNGTTFVERAHKQISRPRFYAKPYRRDRRAIEDLEYSEKLIEVQLDVGGAKQVAHVMFFRGRVDSIQFKRPLSYYAGKKLKVMGVRPGKVALSHAAAIDRLEHGREP